MNPKFQNLLMLLLLAFLPGVLGSVLAVAGSPAAAKKVSNDFQWQIVEFFSSERCDLVRGATNKEIYPQLRPNILAIVAFCQPTDADPEELFRQAEEKDPAGDLIMVLHAKFVWKRNHEEANPLWEKVLKYARNPSLKSMARRYIADEVEEDEVIHLSQFSYQGKVKLGEGFESNPTLPQDSNPAATAPQAFSNLAFSGGVQRWYPFGSLSANYNGTYARFWKTTSQSFFDNQLELPVSLRLGTFEDIVFRPFTGISFAGGGRHFGSKYGLGVLGVAYRHDYKQSVQGSVFTDRLLFPALHPQEGTHFRFEYNWEFFPTAWTYRFLTFMEHVRATNDFNNGTDIKYTHTDVGAQFRLQNFAKGITWEFELGLSARLDAIPSEFNSTLTGNHEVKRRDDFTLDIKPSATLPLMPELQLNAYYEFNRVFSNFGPGDFADYNILDHVFGLMLVTEFTNY